MYKNYIRGKNIYRDRKVQNPFLFSILTLGLHLQKKKGFCPRFLPVGQITVLKMDNKQKQAKLNRVLYVAMILILCIMAVVIAVTSSLNRAKRGNDTNQSAQTSYKTPDTQKTPNTKSPVTTTAAPEETTAPQKDKDAETTAPDKTTVVDVSEDALPDFYLPVSGNIAKAHDDASPVYSNTMDDYRVHLGIDIATNVGTPVCAAADGTISQIWEDPLMGNCISIAHKGGAVTTYKNLAPDFDVEMAIGDNVAHNQVIGTVGESALVEIADEPHLHFEMTVGGEPVNPTDYLPELPSAVNTSSQSMFEG